MGSYSGLELQRPSGLPDTPPPELVSPSSCSYSFSISEARPWSTAAPISPPMSSYDPSTKAGMPREPEQSQTQRDVKSSAPRQQLPSLSSLFGPPSQIRPFHSPLSDRPSPATGLPSPFERPRSASSRSDRRPLATSRPHHFPGPLSPQPRDFEPASYGFRNESVSSGRWSQSSFSEPRRPDYALSGQEPPRAFRPMSDRPHLPALGNRLSFETSFETSFGPRKQSQYHSPISSQSQGPPGPISMEVAPVKDGLGPKIWTGTHFLPRFVRQGEVPGEGLCYFYDDGTHCKAVIDGEPVNAHWGVTKAGKPRKRLAIACLTCREKKIKCDPDFPRCVQCEKFGRVCKFKNAPRGGHNTSPTLSPPAQEDSRQITPHDRAGEQSRPRSASSEAVSPRTTTLKRPASTEDLPGLPPKKAKEFHDPYHPVASRPGPLLRVAENAKTGIPWQHRELPRLSDDILCRSWRADPYVFAFSP
ncbi:hypothetical protein DL770_005036 [Monosporascus sp. CRB-9-2]|nr:hypothetical protein DL770_005036 [Monosporascus sp. CRB-9-2]